MSKKLELNGLWESSRMMLPQHKESAIRNQRESQRISRPIRDVQEIQQISAVLSLSQMYKKPIELILYEIVSCTFWLLPNLVLGETGKSIV